MNIANLGKVLAGQAIEGTKNTVMAAITTPEVPRQAEAKPAPDNIGAVIIGQIQAMQRPLAYDQELHVLFRAGDEMLRVTEVFVPSPTVLVFAGTDPQGNITRVISPSAVAQVTCKIIRTEMGLAPVRVNVLTPKPRPEPAA